jgi:hypothetical protein
MEGAVDAITTGTATEGGTGTGRLSYSAMESSGVGIRAAEITIIRMVGDRTRTVNHGTRIVSDGTRMVNKGTRTVSDNTRMASEGTRMVSDSGTTVPPCVTDIVARTEMEPIDTGVSGGIGINSRVQNRIATDNTDSKLWELLVRVYPCRSVPYL